MGEGNFIYVREGNGNRKLFPRRSLVDVQSLEAKFHLWCIQWSDAQQRAKVCTTIQALQHCAMRAVKLPNILMLLRIWATLPVTTAEAERTFSKVDRTATAARASMDEDCLDTLVLIQTHRDRTPSNEEIIYRFVDRPTAKRRFVL